MTEEEAHYQMDHITTRTHVERAFGQLKAKWQSVLSCLRAKSIDRDIKIISSAIILHNCAINLNLGLPVVAENTTVENIERLRRGLRENYVDRGAGERTMYIRAHYN